MRILVLGGTAFVGRHIVEHALNLGHQVTVFHRGQTGADLFPGVEHVLGDRDGGLEALGTTVSWDWVIDTSGYVPRIVRQSCEALQGRCEKYLFISTISVYASMKEPGVNELSPLATLDDHSVETVDGATYGGLKVLCERTVSDVYPDALIVRPGMIVGPYDRTDRFTYWFQRGTKGGKMISLCERDEPVQFIDARDLADFCLHLLNLNESGVFNATGPVFSMTWGDIFDEASLQAGTQYEIVRPPLDWLKARGVENLPSQFPSEDGNPGVYRVSIEKALANGLKFLPLSQTVSDTIVWRHTMPDPLKVGLSPEREIELVAEYEGDEV
jgi:2'-hydroxyisoflavone reductase